MIIKFLLFCYIVFFSGNLNAREQEALVEEYEDTYMSSQECGVLFFNRIYQSELLYLERFIEKSQFGGVMAERPEIYTTLQEYKDTYDALVERSYDDEHEVWKESFEDFKTSLKKYQLMIPSSIEKKQKGMSEERRNTLAKKLFQQVYEWRVRKNVGYIKDSSRHFLREMREVGALHIEFQKLRVTSNAQERTQWIEKQKAFELKMKVDMQRRLVKNVPTPNL